MFSDTKIQVTEQFETTHQCFTYTSINIVIKLAIYFCKMTWVYSGKLRESGVNSKLLFGFFLIKMTAPKSSLGYDCTEKGNSRKQIGFDIAFSFFLPSSSSCHNNLRPCLFTFVVQFPCWPWLEYVEVGGLKTDSFSCSSPGFFFFIFFLLFTLF